MDILEKIVAHKRIEVAQRQVSVRTKTLEKSPLFERICWSMKASLLNPDKVALIAEFKRRSPSQGDINTTADVAEVTKGYVAAGVSGLSVLTDFEFFGGKTEDVIAARAANDCPILRKEFIINEYQILEAKAMGADVILLIAECLNRKEVAQLSAFAKSLGMEVLLEIHSEKELGKLTYNIDMVGVNNRNLATFEVNTQTSVRLFDKIPTDFLKISESGISSAKTIIELKKVGFQGFLIGEAFMKTKDPAAACLAFVEKIRNS